MPYKDPEKQKLAQRKSYEKNREKVLAAGRESMRKRREQIFALLAELKDQPCMDCGQKFPPKVMEFHHIDPTTKTNSVARLAWHGVPTDRLLAEIEKCELLCANCHRMR